MIFYKNLLGFSLAALCSFGAVSAFADDDDDGEASGAIELLEVDYGFAGLLSKANRIDLDPITISTSEPLSQEPWSLKSGRYYTVDIIADGSGEIAIAGPEFFHAVWVNEVVVNGLETRPIGVSSFEFDEAGTIHMSFVAILPGQYEIYVPGARGDSQKIAVTIQ